MTSPKIFALSGIRKSGSLASLECRGCAVDAGAPPELPPVAGMLHVIGISGGIPLCRLCLIQAANEISGILEKL